MSMPPGMHHRMGVISLQYQQKSVVASTPQCCHVNTPLPSRGSTHEADTTKEKHRDEDVMTFLCRFYIALAIVPCVA